MTKEELGLTHVPNSAGVWFFDQDLGITDRDFLLKVSDHYPVFAEFRITGPDDDV